MSPTLVCLCKLAGVRRVSSEHVVIIHLSRGTGMGEAKRYLARTLRPENMQRATILMDMLRNARRAEPAGGGFE
jgi:hypothetical protein